LWRKPLGAVGVVVFQNDKAENDLDILPVSVFLGKLRVLEF
jgi:hypothetical protein